MLFLISFFLLTNKCIAIDSNISIKGMVKDSICEVAPSSKFINVDLGLYDIRTFNNIGDASKYIPFDILLTACGSGVSKVKVRFLGLEDMYNPNLLKIDMTSSSASGVGIQLLDRYKNEIRINSPSKEYIIKPSEDNDLIFYARIMSSTNKVEAGNLEAMATFELEFI